MPVIDDLLKAVKAMTRKSTYYDTEARTGITKTDCTKPRVCACCNKTRYLCALYTHESGVSLGSGICAWRLSICMYCAL